MDVFEVKSTNLDCNDGVFCNVLFDDINKAINHCKIELEQRNGNNITEDFDGVLTEFQGKSLTYTPCKDKPAVYYNSKYGNYKCVIFVETRKVH